MTIEIKILTLGMVATNCYIIGDTKTNEAVVIDAADSIDRVHQEIVKTIEERIQPI